MGIPQPSTQDLVLSLLWPWVHSLVEELIPGNKPRRVEKNLGKSEFTMSSSFQMEFFTMLILIFN